MVRDVRPDDIGVSVSYPMPNTRFHQIVQEQIGAQANWRDSGDLTMMYQGPFPTEALRPVFSEIISACLSLETPLRVAFLGPEATFTHMAARTRFGLSARYLPAATMLNGSAVWLALGQLNTAAVRSSFFRIRKIEAGTLFSPTGPPPAVPAGGNEFGWFAPVGCTTTAALPGL